MLVQLARLRENERTTLHIAVTAEVFRGRLQNDIGAEVDRALQRGSRERAVDDGRRSAFTSQRADRGDVDDLHQRIRRALDPEESRFRTYRPAHRVDILHRYDVRRQVPPAKEFA